VVADFDGDKTADTATVALTRCLISPQYLGGNSQYNTRFAIHVEWPYPGGGSNAAQGVWPLPECKEACRALGAVDIDHNGISELGLVVDKGASTEFLWLLELAASERGPVPLTVAAPGSPTYPAGQPVRLALVGSVRHYDFLSCLQARLVATRAVLSSDYRTWHLKETVFRLNGRSLTIVSTREYDQGSQPQQYPQVAGPACFPFEFPGP